MATLLGTKIKNRYTELLKTSVSTGLDGTLRAIEDGDATASSLHLSSTNAKVVGGFEVTVDTQLGGNLNIDGLLTFNGSSFSPSSPSFSGSVDFNDDIVINHSSSILWENLSNASAIGIRTNNSDSIDIFNNIGGGSILEIRKDGAVKFKEFEDTGATPLGGELVYTSDGFYIADNV